MSAKFPRKCAFGGGWGLSAASLALRRGCGSPGAFCIRERWASRALAP
ncbi:hypothetical protein BBSC_0073 [Bifidobacterium scardovii JCM 12489 = DSM 13734]|nr:hypothetical protein BBSC_0073 [Bifidobacterium scardovii JCM 12489 = DSM 13734]